MPSAASERFKRILDVLDHSDRDVPVEKHKKNDKNV
jgi:hypothetical protein